MPPGDINNNNLINMYDTLTQEAVASLLLQFESRRKSLRCPHCEKMGQFRRNGSIKTDPPMPIFRCHRCGKTFKARTMTYIVQSLVSPNSLVSSLNNETLEFSTIHSLPKTVTQTTRRTICRPYWT
ncbi:hypothetical protein BCV72DRAFT_326385 [Rhizopus microsporus var. microsporus]|uniref:Transposase n=1 Tax=Rhizopus microsporus var. microsporus TaxID=86635 RepID=A0A1X0R696_RHIZD|nr:hypothetical protein BCV72DRAFT_326385 [Rhizopus microsporus var. microsporus]